MDQREPANESLKQVADLFSRPGPVEQMDERVDMGLREWEARVVGQYFPPSGRVLDLGCGCGREALALVHRGYEVVAADMSAGQLERARANATQAGVKLELTLVDGLEVPCGPFDAVTLWAQLLGNMERREDQLALLRNCPKALRPGGIVSASGHYADYCRSEWGKQTEGHWFYPTGSWQAGELKYGMFSEETLAELVAEAGCEVLATEVPGSLPAIVHVVGRRSD